MGDAEAICEAVTRANMRFVPTKTLLARLVGPVCLAALGTQLLHLKQQIERC
jgi:hypothetical protein